MKIIENTKDLIEFCKELSNQEYITVDLEFLREKSYYAKLCLIQVASEVDSAIIDPLAKGIDLSAFFKVLKNKSIVKVFHSCRQDIEILFNISGFIPEPVFDTQIAAMVCGFGESVSYENLVAHITKNALDKTCRLSDWSKRPLKQNQLEYALSDVTHLRDIYKYLSQRLKETGRDKWIDEENEILKDPHTYVINPNEAWQKIRHRSHSPHFLTVLKELAAWRERRAQSKDTPRQSIVKDEVLLTIAATDPKSMEELGQTRNIRKDVANGKLAAEILNALEKTRKIPPSKYIKPEPEKKYSNGSASLLELLKLLLKIRSQEQGVVARLIADEEELRDFSAFNDKNNPLLKGWRFEVFGRDALELRDGHLSISFNKEKNSIDIKKHSTN